MMLILAGAVGTTGAGIATGATSLKFVSAMLSLVALTVGCWALIGAWRSRKFRSH
jgi:hypothetical protein